MAKAGGRLGATNTEGTHPTNQQGATGNKEKVVGMLSLVSSSDQGPVMMQKTVSGVDAAGNLRMTAASLDVPCAQRALSS
jgi:hypothetical protein